MLYLWTKTRDALTCHSPKRRTGRPGESNPSSTCYAANIHDGLKGPLRLDQPLVLHVAEYERIQHKTSSNVVLNTTSVLTILYYFIIGAWSSDVEET